MSIEGVMKVCAVSVTYGDRFHLLKQSIDSLLKQPVTHIIVVDNSSVPKCQQQLKSLRDNLQGKLEVVHLDENSGSAGGYRRGLQEAYQNNSCEFIWLLDDDNRPEAGALKALTDFWAGLIENDKEQRVALMCYREDREIYKEVVFKNKPNLVIGRNNSFLGFHVCSLPGELMRRIKDTSSQKAKNDDLAGQNYGLVSAVPFGGMFFHKKLLNEIGYPNRDLFLYGDDWDFSYRITKKGGKIFLLLNSVIEDLEKSWHRKNRESLFKVYLLENFEDFRLYYIVRNRIYFEKKHLMTHPVIYWLNKLILLIIVGLFGFHKKRNKIRIIRRAIRDGNKGRLGKYACSSVESPK